MLAEWPAPAVDPPEAIVVAGSPMNSERKEPSELARGLALLVWIAWEIVGLTGAGVALGWAMNHWWGTPQILSIVLGMAGLTLAIYRIHQVVRGWERDRK